jgi:DMSO/TMAO reductase YedYZ molybdopterin-dependent catalytic subunit
MASALHSQTILCLTYADRPIAPKFGTPMRLKMTTKKVISAQSQACQ